MTPWLVQDDDLDEEPDDDEFYDEDGDDPDEADADEDDEDDEDEEPETWQVGGACRAPERRSFRLTSLRKGA
jgi:hypothetical protein